MTTPPGGPGQALVGVARRGLPRVVALGAIVGPAPEGADEGEGARVVRGHEDARGCCWGHAQVIGRRQKNFTALKGALRAPTT